VGVFVLVALAILVFGSLWIAGSSFFGAPRASYEVLLENSSGLQAGDRVRMAGVSVGRIQHVDLRPGDEWPVSLHVALKPDVSIKTDATAKVGVSGLLGSGFLEIDPGTPGAQPLPAGSRIRGSASAGLDDAMGRVNEISDKVSAMMDQVSGILDTVSGEMGPILSNLDRLLSEENSENLEQILANLRDTTDDVGPRVSSLITRLDNTALQIEGGVEGLPGLTSEIELLVTDLRAALGPDGERLARVLQSAETSLNRADETLSVLGDNREEIEATLRDLHDTLSNLKAFSQQVKERPFSLVRIKPEPERQPGDGAEDPSR
jgi:phospholipid/cholesterol/gamma-HCH transport system substrate-binding protein